MLNVYVEEWRYYPVGLFFLLINIGLLTGQKVYKPADPNPFKESWRWQSFDELEGRGVRSVFEDVEGTIWFATDQGILEYNGYTWIAHQPEGINAVPFVEITASSKYIFACTATAVYRYNGLCWLPYFVPDSTAAVTMRSLENAGDTCIRVSTSRGVFQLSVYDSTDITFFTTAAYRRLLEPKLKTVSWVELPLSSEANMSHVSHTMTASDGAVWFVLNMGTEGNLLRFFPSSISEGQILDYQLFTSTPDFPFGSEQNIIQAQDGRIWVTNDSYDIGICTFDGKKWEYLRLSDVVGGDEFITDITQTADGTIWFGGIGHIHSLRNGIWNVFKAPDYPVPANRLKFFQGNNHLWITGVMSRVNLIDYSESHWKTFSDLNFQCQTPDGKRWFIEVNGRIITEDQGKWTAWDTQDGLMDAPVRLIATRKGQIWVGGSHKGVAATAFFHSGRWEKELHPNLSWGIDYRAMFEAADGTLWFGSSVDLVEDKGHQGGVIQLINPQSQPHQWQHHTINHKGLTQSNAYGIGQSRDGRIWIGGTRLLSYDGEKWSPSPDNRLHAYVNTIHSTPDGFLVVGSRVYGVFTFDGKTWQHYNTDSGLTSNTIISVFAESDSNIWAVTEEDICRYDGKKWICGIFPKEMNLPVEGGIILRANDGTVWISRASREWKRRALSFSKTSAKTYENFVSYRYAVDTYPPETVINLYAKTLSPYGSTLFGWEGKDYRKQTPDPMLAYSYRLNKGEWSDFSITATQSFSNLTPGTYTLEVVARDFDMNTDPTPASVQFKVLLPFWQQTWFIVFVVGVMMFILFFLYQILIRNKNLNIINETLHQENDSLINRMDETPPVPHLPEIPPQIEPEISLTREKIPLKSLNELEPAPVIVTSSDEKLLARLSEIMEENLSDPNFNVNKMCEMVNLSHMHFIRKVKQLTGLKPQEMLRSFRMKRARDLLRQKKLNVAEISYMVGYDLPNSFTRAFKKEFGVTPSEFADRIRQNGSLPESDGQSM
ncbi:MAG: helix-turn-helix domain-containing protein [Bacteroidia bacterium]|nr:helix-turn-helix domain-containing protein [Bacteroidia bacterium]